MLRRRTAVWLAGLAILSACTPKPKPEVLPPQSVSLAEPEEQPEAEDPVAVVPPTKEETLVILDGPEKGREKEAPSLVAAARAERERRERTPEPILEIDDKNLSRFATGKLTTTDRAAAESADDAVAHELDDPAEQESHWRSGVRERRQRWRDAADEVMQLESQVAGLRTRFYSEDDPYVRDGQIKPAWDRTLDHLAAARQRVVEAQLDLQTFLEEGRRAGALPGWLRDGLELEPARAPDREDRPEEGIVGEPNVVDEGR